jgi:hypothetical protein
MKKDMVKKEASLDERRDPPAAKLVMHVHHQKSQFHVIGTRSAMPVMAVRLRHL